MARYLTKSMRGLLRALQSKRGVASLSRWIGNAWQRSAHGAQALPESQGASTERPRDRRARAAGRFIDATYRNRQGRRHYKLFIPAGSGSELLPLVVMLHGCSQTPDDLASATGMNALAARHRFAVVYPTQSIQANSSKCWNWFRPSDQLRGHGEPAIIAGLTRHLIRAYGLDRERVYAAGLSAGAAMTVVLAHNYPELYAAVGVHSGLPYAVAHDVTSALTAMRGESADIPAASSGPPTPTLIFHGDRDQIVHPRNAQRLLDQFIQGDPVAVSIERCRIDHPRDGHASTRTVVKKSNGTVICEHWLVHGGGHAWFGGSGRGPQDSSGPDASRELVRFFSGHRLRQAGPSRPKAGGSRPK